MTERSKTPSRGTGLVAAAALGLLMLNYPFLAVFDAGTRVFGIPLLWAYLFAVWVLIIALVAWLARDA
jgi:hypothetical protein